MRAHGYRCVYHYMLKAERIRASASFSISPISLFLVALIKYTFFFFLCLCSFTDFAPLCHNHSFSFIFRLFDNFHFAFQFRPLFSDWRIQMNFVSLFAKKTLSFDRYFIVVLLGNCPGNIAFEFISSYSHGITANLPKRYSVFFS